MTICELAIINQGSNYIYSYEAMILTQDYKQFVLIISIFRLV